MLEVNNICGSYEQTQVLHGVSLSVSAGEILCLMGRNGAGKTTTLKAIMGLVRCISGNIILDGKEVSNLPAHQIPRLGIGYVPQGRRLFSELSVAENIEIGMMTRNSDANVQDRVLDIFPRLRERMHQRANTLSGGEQQMLATARALCLEPDILLLDEPTEGLQPSMIEQIHQSIIQLKSQGVAIILVEQRIDAVMSLADNITFLENGRSPTTMSIAELRKNNENIARFVGV